MLYGSKRPPFSRPCFRGREVASLLPALLRLERWQVCPSLQYSSACLHSSKTVLPPHPSAGAVPAACVFEVSVPAPLAMFAGAGALAFAYGAAGMLSMYAMTAVRDAIPRGRAGASTFKYLQLGVGMAAALQVGNPPATEAEDCGIRKHTEGRACHLNRKQYPTRTLAGCAGLQWPCHWDASGVCRHVGAPGRSVFRCGGQLVRVADGQEVV